MSQTLYITLHYNFQYIVYLEVVDFRTVLHTQRLMGRCVYDESP
jgi:hypothetical protein